MKKLLALTLAMLFLGVGIASATDFTVTGDYFARGTWSDNWTGVGNDTTITKLNQYGVYDHELNVLANWQISKATNVTAKFEIRDENWGGTANGTDTNLATQSDDNIWVENVYGKHTFANGIGAKVGLITTSTWASDFGNDSVEAYRVMFDKMTPLGYALVFTEKSQGSALSETGAFDMDADAYVAGLVTKVGSTSVLPLIVYADYEPANFKLYKLDLGVNGSFNNIGWKGEFIYADYNYDSSADGIDYSLYGAYIDVWTQVNAFKVGAFIAYGSFDEDVEKGFYFGDDFTANGAMILGDEAFMFQSGTNLAAGYALEACTLYGVYGSYAVNEKLTLSAYFGYADSNYDFKTAVSTQTKWDGASAWEINVQGEYKITDNVTYSVGAAQAQLEYGDTTTDPDEAIEVFHKLAFSF